MAKKEKLSLDEILEQALLKDEDKPYGVPSNWVWTKLGDIVKVSSGNGLTSSEMNQDGDIPVYGGNGVTGYHDRWNIEDTTIVIGRVGFYCGCVHLITEKAWVTDNALIVYFPKGQIDIIFLYWLLLNTNLRQNDSSTAQPVISGTKIYSLSIPLPPLPEQQRIVATIESLFDKLGQAKELVQNALDSFEARISIILHKAFTGELTEEWRKKNIDIYTTTFDKIGNNIREDLDLFCLPETWIWVDLNFIMKNEKDFCYGVIQPGDDNIDGPRLIRVCDLVDGTVDISNLRGISDEIHKQYKRSIVQGGEILVSVVGTIGRIAVVPKECAGFNIARAIAKIPIKDFNVRFIYYWLNSPVAQLWMVGDAREVARKTLNLEQLKTIPVPLPPLQEQDKIVNILDCLLEKEQKARELYDVIDNIDLMKKSILARAFRGELGTNNPEEESALELLKKVLSNKMEVN